MSYSNNTAILWITEMREQSIFKHKLLEINYKYGKFENL